MSHSKIGFQSGNEGNSSGIGDWERRLDAAGIPFCLKSVGNAGVVYEGQQLAKASGVPHTLIFRCQAGPSWDVPDYGLPAFDAALRHWHKHISMYPPELDKSVVWLETVNELDRNRADWIGEFCKHTATFAIDQGYRWAGPSWSSGEPEDYHWWTDGMQRFLRLASAHRGRIAVAVHEYSYNLGPLMDTFPWGIGRFTEIVDVCADMGVPAPTILVTELGWAYNDIPDTATAIEHLAAVAALYNAYDVAAAIWRLDGPDQHLANSVNALIRPWGDYIVNTSYPDGPPPPPPPPPPEPTPEYVRVKTSATPYLNLRTADGRDIGDLVPGGGPLKVVGEDGDWLWVAGRAHRDYLEGV